MEPTDLERLTVLNDEECMEGCEFHPIGVGGHGNVYKVQNRRNTEFFARKVMSPIAGRVDSQVIETFKNEIRAVTKLCDGSHPNIIRVFTSGLLRPTLSLFFIDMQYCEGNLKDYLAGQNVGDLPLLPMETRAEQVTHLLKEVIRPILSGLEFIHSNNEVHRDFTPTNRRSPFDVWLIAVLYSSNDGTWKIADFGLSSPGYTSQSVATLKGRGGPCYRPPELLREVPDPSYTKKLDIWAVGCILYEVCVGKKLFSGDRATLIFALERKEVEVDLNDLVEEQRESIRRAIKSALQINPSDRPSVNDLMKLVNIGLCPKYLSNPSIKTDHSASLSPIDNITDRCPSIKTDHSADLSPIEDVVDRYPPLSLSDANRLTCVYCWTQGQKCEYFNSFDVCQHCRGSMLPCGPKFPLCMDPLHWAEVSALEAFRWERNMTDTECQQLSMERLRYLSEVYSIGSFGREFVNSVEGISEEGKAED